MKRYSLLVVGLLLSAGVVSAQENYTVAATAGQVLDLTDIVTAYNEQTCLTRGQVFTCTQAQACVGPGVSCVGGAACTAAQARTCGARIFPLTQAGREEYVTFQLVAPDFVAQRAALSTWYQDRQCRFWATANGATRSSMCTTAGLPSTCRLCP
jgi:hypothetical protein